MSTPGAARDVTKGRPVKPAKLYAEAYCLRLSPDGSGWHVVDNSATSILGEHPEDNPERMDVQTLGAMGAMQAQAEARERWVTDRVRAHGGNPDDHVIVFMAATRQEAADLTGLPLGSRVRK